MTLTEVPLTACEPWCVEGNGHAGEHPADRMCTTEPTPVQLTQHDPVSMGGGTWVRDWLDVQLRRRPETGAPEVCIGWEREPAGIEINLTPAEAAQLRDVLTAALERCGHDVA